MVSVLQRNCRGFRSNFEELKLLIRDYDPACIFLQELILGVNYPFLFPPTSYISYTSHHRGNNGRGGAGLLVWNSIHLMLFCCRLNCMRLLQKKFYLVLILYVLYI